MVVVVGAVVAAASPEVGLGVEVVVVVVVVVVPALEVDSANSVTAVVVEVPLSAARVPGLVTTAR